MKNLSLLIIACAFSFISCAQNIQAEQAPAIVVNAFKSRFPKASDIEWKKKGSQYEVEFETGLSGQDHKMRIDSTGRVLFHKQDISRNDLPAAVIAALDKNYPGYKLDDLERIEKETTVQYKLEVKKGAEEWKLLFDQAGTILEKMED